MSKDASSAASRAPKDAGASGGLLFKASNTLKRSPSKKQKEALESSFSSLDHALHQPEKPHGDDDGLPNGRPEMHRVQTSPLENVSSKSATKDPKRSQSVVEANTAAIIQKKEATKQNAGGGHAIGDTMGSGGAINVPLPSVSTGSSGQNPNAVYQHIHEMANKRISTLDYFRKAHEGRIFWFKTLHFSHQDLSRLPSLSPARLSRRATNYLLLGLSIPSVLDGGRNRAGSVAANATAAYDFLRQLNSLLGEFETYQQLHPPDGSTQSALSRARIPHMFKRATQATTGRTRRTSSNTSPEIGLPLQQGGAAYATPAASHPYSHHHHASQSSVGTSQDGISANHFPVTSNSSSIPITAASLSAAAASLSNNVTSSSVLSIPATNAAQADLPNSSVFPSENPYTFLLTPALPFAPDFHAVFATLCDVLIDAYQRVIALVNSPAVCSLGGGQGATHSLAEIFAKADARLRKVIVGGVVREFELATRDSCKREVAGVGKVVLGGLMGT